MQNVKHYYSLLRISREQIVANLNVSHLKNVKHYYTLLQISREQIVANLNVSHLQNVKHYYTLSEILRDFKEFTFRAIIKQIEDEAESRREWMLKQMEYA